MARSVLPTVLARQGAHSSHLRFVNCVALRRAAWVVDLLRLLPFLSFALTTREVPSCIQHLDFFFPQRKGFNAKKKKVPTCLYTTHSICTHQLIVFIWRFIVHSLIFIAYSCGPELRWVTDALSGLQFCFSESISKEAEHCLNIIIKYIQALEVFYRKKSQRSEG